MIRPKMCISVPFGNKPRLHPHQKYDVEQKIPINSVETFGKSIV